MYTTAINEDRNQFMIIGFLVKTEKEDSELSYEHVRWVDVGELMSLIDRGMQKDFKDAKIEELVQEED